jgi:hypothetical protein
MTGTAWKAIRSSSVALLAACILSSPAFAGVGTSSDGVVSVPTPSTQGTAFDWADASVGAAFAIAVALLLVGCAVMLRRRPARARQSLG